MYILKNYSLLTERGYCQSNIGSIYIFHETFSLNILMTKMSTNKKKNPKNNPAMHPEISQRETKTKDTFEKTGVN